ncbi:39S ribosomal protein L44, mitochondrial [Fundulus heteroclitus]|uniref:39S ribosomal protein L44, mitochondrial n=1 Tax=Fundulus heteroclitus TaxID=8078 RepID=UPI00165BCEA6|nr:39S ribosomal protein L44, mitochondrial [Fundulus heteroclitus]XP_036005855.1 39S ribosomal protein L44, mitochondrial [Fundulus heteroclitus]
MAARYMLTRGALNTFGLHRQLVPRSPATTQVREKKRWMKAYTHLMAKKLKLEGPPPPKPRWQQPNWDYHSEVQAFSARLHENFSLELLKTAFVNPCYLQAEQRRRQRLGLDSETTALLLEDNLQLSEKGAGLTQSFLTDWCRASFPGLPHDGVSCVVGHLTGPSVVCYVARNLGVEDLAMSAEFPVPDETLRSTFMAVVGALEGSSGAERAAFFLRDFLSTQLIGKDLFDMWPVVDPMGLLVEELTKRSLPPPEPRLIRSAGASTVLPLYFVGLYSDGKLLAQGPGETLVGAEEEAARVALRKLYGYTENRRPFDFSPQQQHQPTLLQSVGGN